MIKKLLIGTAILAMSGLGGCVVVPPQPGVYYGPVVYGPPDVYYHPWYYGWWGGGWGGYHGHGHWR